MELPLRLKLNVTSRSVIVNSNAYFLNISIAGEEYLFKGPGTYRPRIEEAIVQELSSVIIGESQAIRLRAKQELTDAYGDPRKTGDEWLYRTPGAYLPQVQEEVIEVI